MEFLVENHPKQFFQDTFDKLIGIEDQKNTLLLNLELIFNKEKIDKWLTRYHREGLWGISFLKKSAPLVILHGEVGCGKTELASSIATPLAALLKTRSINVIQSPSNIRGSGLVGEISNRITSITDKAISTAKEKNIPTILIFDEADDIATSRSQNQAHHEDRAGLNSLIKQVDKIGKSNVPLAVILITNRLSVLDPAIRRRASCEIQFNRPNELNIKIIFQTILKGIKYHESDLTDILGIYREKRIPFSYSDIVTKVYKPCVVKALNNNHEILISDIKLNLKESEPTPLLESGSL